MASSSRIEREQFNGHNFELRNIKMEDILVYQEQWTMICLGTQPTGTSMDKWEKIKNREKSTIRLCLMDLVLLNVSGEDSAKKLLENMGSLY
jgi:hypothetical protein